MTPKRTNRITRREAEQIVGPIRKTISGFKTGYAEAIRGVPVFKDWMGEWSAVDIALRGWIDCWQRFQAGIDMQPLEVLCKRLGAGVPITPEEIDRALSVLRRQEQALTKLPRNFIRSQTDTELIQIELDKLGLTQQ